MKTIFKILIILAVAVLVGGLFYGVVTTFFQVDTNPAPMNDRPANAELNRVERSNAAGELQLPLDSVKNLLIISVIVAVYVHGTGWIKRIKAVPIR